MIADSFSKISQEYDALGSCDISIPYFSEISIPQVQQREVKKVLEETKTKVSTVPGDIPAFILKKFASFISKPLTNVINESLKSGQWPDIFKLEAVTPIPKVHPTIDIEDLRNISGLKNLNKVSEKIISKMMLEDMKDFLDKSQYGNKKGVSIQHYLIKFIDQILMNLDNNSKGDIFSALATFVDWKQAFNRQDPKLGIESFINNGVRPSLIPVLINYFQGREMFVKWHGKQSKRRTLNGGGPQGGTFGIIEFLSQSNANANCVKEDLRWKWVDDLTFIEIINLVNIGIASYLTRAQVPNDLDINKHYIAPENFETTKHLKYISDWTDTQKMKLNTKKTNNMIFNFTDNYQFSTRMSINNEKIDIVEKTKLLGTVITNDLKWDDNTKEIVKKANMRMCLLRKVASFKPPRRDLRIIYIQYVRSILEQSCVVWHSSLTAENRHDIERVQKNAMRIILGNEYTHYERALDILNLKSLEERRKHLSLKFAIKGKSNPIISNIFSLKDKVHDMELRNTEIYNVNNANTERYKNSAVPFMQRLLNEYEKEKHIKSHI